MTAFKLWNQLISHKYMILLTLFKFIRLIIAIVGTKTLYLLILTHGGKNESSTKFSNASYSW